MLFCMTFLESVRHTQTASQVVSFFCDPPQTDDRYSRLYAPENEPERIARQRVDDLWSTTNAYLDSDVQAAAPRDFLGRFWEVYLAAGLLSKVVLVPTAHRNLKKGGPDLLLANPRVYVEAIAARPGTGPDAVTAPQPLVVRAVPVREITLRLRAAIEEKVSKHAGYVLKKVLSATDPYVIGINGSGIPSTRGEPDVPWIVKSVFPLGNRVLHFDPKTLEVVRASHEPEHDLVKRSGANVAKDIFLGPTHAGISAIIYCWADEYNMSVEPGKDFIVVHNPFASNPVGRDILPAALEYWLEGDQVKVVQRGA